jgi:hypothetical protein
MRRSAVIFPFGQIRRRRDLGEEKEGGRISIGHGFRKQGATPSGWVLHARLTLFDAVE